MNRQDSTIYKAFMILYPLALYFLMDVLIVWAAEYLLSAFAVSQPESFLAVNTQAIAAVVFLVITIPVFYRLYKKDYVDVSEWIYSKPGYFALLALIGVLASHGLSALVTLMGVDSLAGNYSEIEEAVFAASPVLVILQTVVLAPLSEELLFRGLLYNRLRRYLNGFWLPALISSAIFGIYHFNLAQGIFAFLFGLLLCAVYDKIRNLWACIALHVGGNLVSVIFSYIGFTYPEVWIFIIAMAVSLAAAWALYHFLIRPLRKII